MLLSSQQSNARPGGHKKVPGIKSGGAAMSAEDFALRHEGGSVREIRIVARKKDGSLQQEFSVTGSYDNLCRDAFVDLLNNHQFEGVREHNDYVLGKFHPSRYPAFILRGIRPSPGKIDDWEILDVIPALHYIQSDLWIAFAIELPRGNHWLFYQRTSQGFINVSVPEEITVRQDGSFLIMRYGHVQFGKHPWPWPLLNFFLPAYQVLDKMLKPDDKSILTMIAQSQQPFLGLGKKLIEELAELRKTLLEYSPWPTMPEK
jgi:hypothetical protein